MFIDELTDSQVLRLRAILIAENLCQPFEALGVEGAIAVDNGGALSPRDGDTEATLPSLADENMYRAGQSHLAYRGV